jgi:CPA2 family monovalent cation:H+ antiporter-2
MLALAQIERARWLLLAIPDALEGGQVIAEARKRNADVDIVAQAHSNGQRLHLEKQGANHVIMSEREIADGMSGRVLDSLVREAG